MLLIHTALFCEAKPLINYFDLIQYNKYFGYKLYKNKEIILAVCGIGKKNTVEKLNFIYDTFDISNSINVGICGCSDKNIKIGELFSIVNEYEDLKKSDIDTVDSPCTNPDILKSKLVDMEFKYFFQISQKYLSKENINSFKVVSDHLDNTIPNKSFVENLIENSIEKWYNYL